MVERIYNKFIFKVFSYCYKYLLKKDIICFNFQYDDDFWGNVL